jgi:hypothetical protein
LVGLCLLVLAVMPVAAQAEGKHWHNNGVLMAEGESVPIVMFGSEVNFSQPLFFSEVNCMTVGGGTIENPVGGGPGVGRTNSLTSYECHGEPCEKEVLLKFGVTGRPRITWQNNPAATKEPAVPGWSDVLEENTVAGVSSVREKIGEPFVTFKTPSPPGMIRETATCEIPSTGEAFATAIYEGEYKPEIGVAKAGNLNGTSAATPSQVKFNGNSTGGLQSQGAREANAFGNLKYLGYDHQELIAVTGTVLTLKLTPEGFINAGGEWVFSGPERKVLTIENPTNTPAELLTQQIKVTKGVANFTPVFLGAPEPPNCSMFSNPPVVTLPAGGKCNVGVESAGQAGTFANYVLTYKEAKETAKTVELKVND